jgi:hypothetical protein
LLERQAPNWLAEHRAWTKLILGIGLSLVGVFDPLPKPTRNKSTKMLRVEAPNIRRPVRVTSIFFSIFLTVNLVPTHHNPTLGLMHVDKGRENKTSHLASPLTNTI